MQSPRRSWVKRHKFLTTFLAVIAALIAITAIPRALAASAPRDYHDPGQLAQAVKAHEPGAISADCAHLTGAHYTCAVGFPGGTLGSYAVIVAADGTSYTES
jgi:hypothetical protein